MNVRTTAPVVKTAPHHSHCCCLGVLLLVWTRLLMTGVGAAEELQCGNYDTASPLLTMLDEDSQDFIGVSPERQCDSSGSSSLLRGDASSYYRAPSKIHWHIHEIENGHESRIQMVPENSIAPIVKDQMLLFSNNVDLPVDGPGAMASGVDLFLTTSQLQQVKLDGLEGGADDDDDDDKNQIATAIVEIFKFSAEPLDIITSGGKRTDFYVNAPAASVRYSTENGGDMDGGRLFVEAQTFSLDATTSTSSSTSTIHVRADAIELVHNGMNDRILIEGDIKMGKVSGPLNIVSVVNKNNEEITSHNNQCDKVEFTNTTSSCEITTENVTVPELGCTLVTAIVPFSCSSSDSSGAVLGRTTTTISTFLPFSGKTFAAGAWWIISTALTWMLV